jgi:hypothetical protein
LLSAQYDSDGHSDPRDILKAAERFFPGDDRRDAVQMVA